MPGKRVKKLTPGAVAQAGREARAALIDSAFEVWYSLGVRRTFTIVAQRFEVSPHTVAMWARQGDWVDRARRVDGEIQSRLQARFADIFVERRAELLMLVRTQIGQYAQLVRDGVIVPVDIKDLERLVRLEMDISGMADNRDTSRRPALEWPSDLELAQVSIKTRDDELLSPGDDGPALPQLADGDLTVDELRAMESALARHLKARKGSPPL